VAECPAAVVWAACTKPIRPILGRSTKSTKGVPVQPTATPFSFEDLFTYRQSARPEDLFCVRRGLS
jgi:hypothetical protein